MSEITETPRTEEIHALINASGGSSDAAFHDMLNFARVLERESKALQKERDEMKRKIEDVQELCEQHYGEIPLISRWEKIRKRLYDE